jgi:hypothetical protein
VVVPARVKHVVFAVPDFEPAVGGTTTQTALQARALARRGYEVEVLTRRRDRAWAEVENVGGLRIQRVGPPGRGAAADKVGALALAPVLARRRGPVGVLQTQMWPDAVFAAGAAWLLPRTLVVWGARG